MKVSFLDLKAAYTELQNEMDVAFQRVMNSGNYILGPEVASFEEEFAQYCNVKHCIGVANGLDALHLSLRAWGIGTGDEVIVPANTFIATWLAVTETGAKPVPVEPSRSTYNIDPDKIKAAITPQTKVIIPVHLYGQPADMERVNQIARQYGLLVLEDAAQAQGAMCYGKRVGSIGNAAAFSFYPGKNLGAFGDAGAITTNDDNFAQSVRRLRNYGSQAKYVHAVEGYNSRLDELQAAFLRIKLSHLEKWNLRRKKLAEFYSTQMKECGVILPQHPEWAEPVWHIYSIQSNDRDLLQSQLAEVGISTLIHYPTPPHLQAAYSKLGFKLGDFPITEDLANRALSIPIGPHLVMEDVEYVVEQIKALSKSNSRTFCG